MLHPLGLSRMLLWTGILDWAEDLIFGRIAQNGNRIPCFGALTLVQFCRFFGWPVFCPDATPNDRAKDLAHTPNSSCNLDWNGGVDIGRDSHPISRSRSMHVFD